MSVLANMHLILTGATGLVGTAVLHHVLSLPATSPLAQKITHLSIIARRAEIPLLEHPDRPTKRVDHCGVLAWSIVCRVSYPSKPSPPTVLTSGSVFYLYTLVRRPRLVLDFTLTLLFNHLLLTTYYAASVPTSLFFWVVMVVCAVLMVVATEQLCVRREMREGLAVITGPNAAAGETGDEVEMGSLLRRD